MTIDGSWKQQVFDSSIVAIERTYLSHLRLGVVLTLLTASILLNARLPAPNDDKDPINNRSPLSGLRFGSLYFAAALAAFFGGLLNYDKLWSDMKTGRAFVQSPRSVFCLGFFFPFQLNSRAKALR